MNREQQQIAIDAQKEHVMAALFALSSRSLDVTCALSDTFDTLAETKEGMTDAESRLVRDRALGELGFYRALNEID